MSTKNILLYPHMVKILKTQKIRTCFTYRIGGELFVIGEGKVKASRYQSDFTQGYPSFSLWFLNPPTYVICTLLCEKHFVF